MPYKDPEKQREYHREYMRARFHGNPEARRNHMVLVYANRKKRRIANTTMIQEAKLVGCLRCSENDPAALDLHHRDPTTKLFNLGATRDQSAAAVRAEIAKCDVLCANCHRKMHFYGDENIAGWR
jgi:hypothetical protein